MGQPTPGSIWWDYNTLSSLLFFFFPPTKNNSAQSVGVVASQRRPYVQTDLISKDRKYLGPAVEEFCSSLGRIQAGRFLFRSTRRSKTHTREKEAFILAHRGLSRKENERGSSPRWALTADTILNFTWFDSAPYFHCQRDDMLTPSLIGL